MKLDKTELREKFLEEEREAKKREWKPVKEEEFVFDSDDPDDETTDDVHEPVDELPYDCRADYEFEGPGGERTQS